MDLRAQITSVALSSVLGMQITIDHIEDITLGTSPGVDVSGLTIRRDQDQSPILEVDRLRASISLSALLQDDRILLEYVYLDTANLEIAKVSAEGEAAPQPDSAPINLAILDWRIRNSRVRYLADRINVDLEINGFQSRNENQDQPLHFELDGALNQLPLNGRGFFGTPSALIAGRNIKFDVDVDWGLVTMQADGHLGAWTLLADSDIKVSLTSPNADPLFGLFAAGQPLTGALAATVNATRRDGESRFVTQASVGAFDLAFNAATPDPIRLDKLSVNFSGSGPSLYEAGAVIDYLQFDPLPFVFSGAASLDGKVLDLEQLNIELAEGRLEASGKLPQFPNVNDAELTLTGQAFDPTILQPLVGTCRLPDAALDWQGDITQRTDDTNAVSLNIRGGGQLFQLSGELPDNPAARTSLSIYLSGIPLPGLGDCFQLAHLPYIHLDLSGDVVLEGDRLQLSKLTLDSELLSLDGEALVTLDDFPSVDSRITLRVPDMRAFVDVTGLPINPFESFVLLVDADISGTTESMQIRAAEFRAGQQTGSLNGTLGNIANFDGLNISYQLDGTDLKKILRDDESTVADALPFKSTGRIERSASEWHLIKAAINILDTEILANATLTDDENYHGSFVDFSAGGSNLQHLIGPIVSFPVPNIPFDLAMQAQLDSGEIKLEAVRAILGEHRLTADLQFDQPPDYSKTSGSILLEGPSNLELARLFGVSLNHLEHPYSLSATLDGSPKQLLLQNFDLRLGDSNLTGDLSIVPGDVTRITGKFASDNIHLPTFEQPPAEDKDAPSGATSERIFSDVRLPLEWMTTYSLDLDYDLRKLTTPGGATSQIQLGILLEDGILQTRRVTWNTGESKGAARLQMTHSPDGGASLRLDVESDRVPIFWLIAGESMPLPKDTPTLFRASATTQGRSIRDWMTQMNGNIIFRSGPGKVDMGMLNWLFGDFLHAISSTVFGGGQGKANLECTAAAVSIKQGIVMIDPLMVARTDKLDIFVSGQLDNREEKPNLDITTRSRTGIGISAAKTIAPKTQVTGTLRNPRLSVNTTSSALSSGAAFMTGGASIIASGLLDRIRTAVTNPCDSVIEAAMEKPVFSQLDPIQ